jgi:hypothetical protein
VKRSYKIAAGVAATLGLGIAAAAFAHPGGVMGMAPGMMHDGRMAALENRQADVARKGAMVMPFDLAKTTHYFDDNATGGIETVKANDLHDAQQVTLIRSHLAKEAEHFAHGDFSDPATIHGNHMPGMAQLAAAGNALLVTYEEVPGGASLTYTSRDQAVVTAIHDWFAAQRSDHAAHAHLHE